MHASICVDREQIYCFSDCAERAETVLEGGRESGWIVDTRFQPVSAVFGAEFDAD